MAIAMTIYTSVLMAREQTDCTDTHESFCRCEADALDIYSRNEHIPAFDLASKSARYIKSFCLAIELRMCSCCHIENLYR